MKTPVPLAILRIAALLAPREQRAEWLAEQRPLRKYYKLTRAGRATLEASHKRYPLLAKLIPSPEEEPA